MVNMLNSQTFDSAINTEQVTLVDFFASWCGPCKMLSPIIDELSNDSEINQKVSIYKIDIDESGDVAQNYGIMSVPTLVFFKKGKETNRITGFVQKEQLKEDIINTSNQ